MTVGIILFYFLIANMIFPVSATETTLTDDVGDVGIVDIDTGQFTEVNGREYLDITKLVCSRDYRKITIKLTVEGEIMDKGDILIWRLIFDTDFFEEYTSGMTEEEANTILLELASKDWVQYTFDLITYNSDMDDFNSYSIIYVNKEILILDDEANLIAGGENSVSGSTLTISFNLPSSKENMSEVAVLADDFSNMGEINYMDYEGIFGEVNDPLEGSSNNNGGNGDQDDSGPGLTIFLSLIVVLVIIGVVVVIFLIRR
jgi:hypothetical protein